jgi:LysM domain
MTSRRPTRRGLGATLALIALAASLGGCLQMASHPTPEPPPTPLPTAPPPATPTPTPGPPTPTPVPTFTTYTVRSGDNLTTIARRYHTTARSLAYWNRATYPSLNPESSHYAPNKLQVGWVLNVLPGGLYSPSPEPTDTGLDGTPAPTEYLGPPTEPPSVDASPGGAARNPAPS